MANKMTVAHVEINTISIDSNGKEMQMLINKYNLILEGALEGIVKAVKADKDLSKIITEVMVGERLKKFEVLNY